MPCCFVNKKLRPRTLLRAQKGHQVPRSTARQPRHSNCQPVCTAGGLLKPSPSCLVNSSRLATQKNGPSIEDVYIWCVSYTKTWTISRKPCEFSRVCRFCWCPKQHVLHPTSWQHGKKHNFGLWRAPKLIALLKEAFERLPSLKLTAREWSEHLFPFGMAYFQWLC